MIFWIDMCCEVQFYMFDLQSLSQEGSLGSTVLNTSFYNGEGIVSDVNTTVEPE